MSRQRTKLLFISWSENCSRSDSIADKFEGISFMVYSPFWGSRYSTIAFKYLSQSLKTLKILFRHRPRRVIVMTPPVIACLPVWIYAKLTGAQYAIDAHSGAFLDRRWTSMLFLHKFFSRRAVVTLVTSSVLAEFGRQWGAKMEIVPDVPICFAEPARMPPLQGLNRMTFVSTFTRDEPLEAFLLAARELADVHFYVTGRLKDADPALLKQAPDNVTFTDFLSNSDYVALLLASDAVICLTTEDHTMQRGAYEAVYLGKPVVTSDYPILRDGFPTGTVHVGSDPDQIAQGISEMKNNLKTYQQQVEQLRLDKLNRWKGVEERLKQLMNTQLDGDDIRAVESLLRTDSTTGKKKAQKTQKAF